MEKNFTILNNKYEIKEINFEDKENIKKLNNDIKDVKNFLCKRIDNKNNIQTNIESSFIIREIARLKNNPNAFCYVIYQTVIMYGIQKQKPTAILIARKGTSNNTYILSLLCKYQLAQKGLGKILLEKLIEKAKLNNIKYIYLESVYDSNFFYKKNNFESDSDKFLHTESEKDEKLSGYLLDLDKIQIGKNNLELNIKKCIYKFILNGNCIYNLIIKNNNKEVGKMIFEDKLHPTFLYCSIEITNINGDTDKEKDILLIILDALCIHNYINKSEMFCAHDNNDIMNLLKKHGYEQMKDKMMLCYFEKVHNSTQHINKTILSLFKNI
jgi:hypothetical protein